MSHAVFSINRDLNFDQLQFNFDTFNQSYLINCHSTDLISMGMGIMIYLF